MKTVKTLLFSLITCLTFVMCTDETPDLSDVALFVSPGSETRVSIASGDKAQYKVEISTIHDCISRFTVSSFDNQFGQTVYVDSICNQKNITWSFIYSAPETDRDSLDVELKFSATDNIGNTVDVTRSVLVTNRFISLSEKTGIVLYDPASGMPDAISLADVSQPFILAAAPDPALADIYIESDPDFSSISWKSNTKTKFIRNNSFNYVAATAANINSVYQGSVREDYVSDIRINDIILVGHGDTAEGVFQVTNIIRNGTVACMQLSFKGIKQH